MILYIDPGTGSMLFSIFIGLAAALYYFFKMAIIKFKFLFTGKNVAIEDLKEPIVIYCEANHYWYVFKPILDELEKRKQTAIYYTSVEKDRFFEQNYSFIKGKYIGEGNKAFAFLNFIHADICLMTTPGLDVYQLRRSKLVKHYSHILHSVDDATSYEIFGIDYYDSVLLSGDYQKDGIKELESKRGDTPKELVTVGSTYLDCFNEKLKSMKIDKSEKTTVLVAPSWGKNSILVKFGKKLLDVLASSDYNIIIRPHPQSLKSELDVINNLKDHYKERFTWDFAPENLDSLSKADIMISDFSSVIFDYCFLFDRPFFYCMQDFNMEIYDAGDLDEEPWKFRILEKIGIELKEEEFPKFTEILEKALKDDNLSKERNLAKSVAWQNIGESGKRTVDFLLSKVERKEEHR